MSSLRTAEVSQILSRWLDRYSPPLSMKDKPRAIQDEAEALLRVLLKFAPQDGYAGWINRALDQLEYQMKTRAWPTKGELGSVCSNMRKEAHEAGGSVAWVLDPVEIAAKRINDKGMVGDEWIYGKRALELTSRNLVTEGQLNEYRSTLFFNMKETWGEDKARAVEALLIQRHEDAKAAGEKSFHATHIPNKTSPAKGYSL